MDDSLIDSLIKELRDEYQIPPFYSNKSLTSNLKEGAHELSRFVEEPDFQEDMTARSLLKNYVYYAFFKKTHEFFNNYNNDLVSWQMSKIGSTGL